MNDENLLAEFNVEKPAKKKKAKRLENLNEQIDTKPKGSPKKGKKKKKKIGSETRPSHGDMISCLPDDEDQEDMKGSGFASLESNESNAIVLASHGSPTAIKKKKKKRKSKGIEGLETREEASEGFLKTDEDLERQIVLYKSTIEARRSDVVCSHVACLPDRQAKASAWALLAELPRDDKGDAATCSTKSLDSKEGSKYGKKVAYSARFDDSASQASSIGAVRIFGPGKRGSRARDIEASYAVSNDRARRVEAQVVPEVQDIEEIVSRRLNDQIQQRLLEERQRAVIAEFVGYVPEQANKKSSRKGLYICVMIAVLIAIALSVSGAILRHKGSRVEPATTQSSTPSPTSSPTSWSRLRFIEAALETVWNETHPWTQIGTPQSNSFLWLTRDDTLDVKPLTSRQIVERYIVGILFYDTLKLSHEASALPYFLQPLSICDWNKRVGGLLTGVTCENETSVTAIELSKYW